MDEMYGRRREGSRVDGCDDGEGGERKERWI
jgi:hypothetical protein